MGDISNGREPCFVCKHPLLDPADIFKTRTAFSKTLLSCKLSRLVQTMFRQSSHHHHNAMSDQPHEVCSACVDLINQVDECEIKLMALENEVKLKYKMPFPIEVHSRQEDVQSAEDETVSSQAPQSSDDNTQPNNPVDPEVKQQQQEGTVIDTVTANGAADGEQYSVISIDGSGSIRAADGSTIVLQTQQVDGRELVVYRDGEEQQQQQQQQHQHQDDAEALLYLSQLEAAGHARHVIQLSADDPLASIVDVVSQEEDDEERLMAAAGNALSSSVGGAAEGKASSGGGMSRIFFCSDCDEAFVSLPHLRRHRLLHGEGRAFPCRFCSRTFATNIALHHHWNTTHPAELKPCPYCSKRFINRSNLNQHISTHREPTFKCEFCSRQFRTKGDMRKHHVFRHSTAKDYQCSECDMSFKVNWLLTRHRLRVHGH